MGRKNDDSLFFGIMAVAALVVGFYWLHKIKNGEPIVQPKQPIVTAGVE